MIVATYVDSVDTRGFRDQRRTDQLDIKIPAGPLPQAGVVAFVRSLDSEDSVAEVEVGDTLFVRVVDGDVNRDTSAKETIEVLLTSGEGDVEPMVLTERVTDGGIFTGALRSASGTVEEGDGVLQVRTGGMVAATYLDSVDEQGNRDQRRVGVVLISGVNHAPVVEPGHEFALTSVIEDETEPAGDAIQILFDGGEDEPITDVHAGAREGIAVLAVDTTRGRWEYSLGGGDNWQSLRNASPESALLLDTESLLRFVPAMDFSGPIEEGLGFRAWDWTSGHLGERADVRENGGSTAFSSAVGTVRVMVTPVNDAPVAQVDSARTEQGVAGLFAVLDNDIDVDGDSLRVVEVTPPGHGTASIEADGIIVYRPPLDFLGEDELTYTIEDPGGERAVGQVIIAVVPLLRPRIVVYSNVDKTSAQPGDTLTYTLNYANQGKNAATDIMFESPFSPTTVYVPNSAQINGEEQTDAEDEDSVTVGEQHIVVRIDMIEIGASGRVQYRVIVK